MRDLDARNNLCFPETFSEFTADQCRQPIHRLFEQQVIRDGAALAIRRSSGDVTYAELNSAANQAAHLLLAKMTSETRPVAMLIDQSYESIVWTLAILKAGSCYAPLDQRLPDPVLRNMVDKLRPGAIISAGHQFDLARKLAAGRFPVISSNATWNQFSGENLDRLIAPESIAYIFHTSGSTGDPKGVMDCHQNVLHNIMRYTNSLKFAPGDILSLVQNPSFSGTVSSLFGALLTGAAVAPYTLHGDGLRHISQWLCSSRLTIFHSVPSIFRQLSDQPFRFADVRLIRLEGDRVSLLDVKHFQANFSDVCTLVNGLGATECGLVRQFFINQKTHLDPTEPIPIGYPVRDMVVRILDADGRELQPGCVGEISVESKFLAMGYWHNPALSNQRFVEGQEGFRRYRTGDLGSMSSDGCLTHRGRVDHRIRIRGEFIDAGDMEKQLVNISGVSQVIVRDIVDPYGEPRLCAYVVAEADSGLNASRLREELSRGVGAQPAPFSVVVLDKLPLTKDLKIDYERLPFAGRERPHLGNDYIAPQTPLEKQIARIWSDVLGIDAVGVTDSFFDLGGDSLNAIRIVNQLLADTGIEVSMAELFEFRTIQQLARSLDGLASSA